LIKLGKIDPLKRLPPGEYVPAKDAEPLYLPFNSEAFRIWSKYVNRDTNEVAFPNELFAQKAGHQIKENAGILSIDSFYIKSEVTSERLAEKELHYYYHPDNSECLTEREFFEAKKRLMSKENEIY
jgi:hypothetical protein